MKKITQKIRLILMIQCEEASRLSSESLERPLQLHERVAIQGHHWVCWSCRQFASQIRFMRNAFRQLSAQESTDLESGPELEPEFKERLKNLRLSDDVN